MFLKLKMLLLLLNVVAKKLPEKVKLNLIT
jgi:hypothetical protein